MKSNVFENFILKKQKQRPLILDGAVGSLLESSFPLSNDKDIWMTSIIKDNPQAISNIYTQYLEKGADILTTFTFRTNPFSLGNYYSRTKNNYISSSEYVEQAVKLVSNLKINDNFLIAGSNPPVEDFYSKRRIKDYEVLKDNHYNHIHDLIKSGSDFIINETIGHFDEIDIVSKICYNNNFPSVISIYFEKDLNLICGKSVYEAISYLDSNFNLLAISTNCIDYKIFKKFTEKSNFLSNLKNRFGYYLNCYDLDKSLINDILNEFDIFNPVFVGTCCGSTPDFTNCVLNHYNCK